MKPDRLSLRQRHDNLGKEVGGERSCIRILVVDDQRIIRQGIRALLTWMPGVEVVGEAESGEAAVRLAARLRPDVVLMDLMMPGMGGTEAIRRVVQRWRDTRILVLTSFASEENVKSAMEAGAANFLSKESEPEDLVRAIRAVHGCRQIEPRLTLRPGAAFAVGGDWHAPACPAGVAASG